MDWGFLLLLFLLPRSVFKVFWNSGWCLIREDSQKNLEFFSFLNDYLIWQIFGNNRLELLNRCCHFSLGLSSPSQLSSFLLCFPFSEASLIGYSFIIRLVLCVSYAGAVLHIYATCLAPVSNSVCVLWSKDCQSYWSYIISLKVNLFQVIE